MFLQVAHLAISHVCNVILGDYFLFINNNLWIQSLKKFKKIQESSGKFWKIWGKSKKNLEKVWKYSVKFRKNSGKVKKKSGKFRGNHVNFVKIHRICWENLKEIGRKKTEIIVGKIWGTIGENSGKSGNILKKCGKIEKYSGQFEEKSG